MRPSPSHVPGVYHGALDYGELESLGLAPDEVLDFSVNSNPFGPSPAVRGALAQVPLDRYPDREATALRRALAAHLPARPEQIVIGNGTAELLWLMAMAFLHSGDRVLVLAPTFGEYERVSRLMGAHIHRWQADPDRSFAVAPSEVQSALDAHAPALAFVCNPNNPTGTVLPLPTLQRWAIAHPHTLFILDEAYLGFVEGLESALVLSLSNILVLRSMTKDYALAGLRLGYAVGPEPLMTRLAAVRPPWNVNALAQAAGLAALNDQPHLRQSLARLEAARRQLVIDLLDCGLEPLPSATHFFLVRVGDGSAFRARLLTRGILVRDCTSFGLPEYVRIATRRAEENAQFLRALWEIRCHI